MAVQAILAAAQVGVSLFGARQQAQAAEQQMTASIERAGLTAGRAAFAGPLERFQVRQQAETQENVRRRELGQTVASQRAASAASGVIGGRTQRLAQARSQAAFSREQALADQQTRLQLLASRERERTAIEDARLSMGDAGRVAQAQTDQATASLFGDLGRIASQNVSLFEQTPSSTTRTPSSNPGRPGGSAGTRF